MNTLVILKREHTYELSYFSDNDFPKRFSSTSLKVKHLNKKLSKLLSKYDTDRIITDYIMYGLESSNVPVSSVETKLSSVYHSQLVNAVLSNIIIINPSYRQDVRVSSGAKPDNILRLSQILISLVDNKLPVLPNHIEEVVSLKAPLNFASISNAVFELTTYNLPTFYWLMSRGVDLRKYNFNKNIESVYKTILDYFGSEARALSVIRYWLGTGFSVNEFLKYTEIITKNANSIFTISKIDNIVLPEVMNEDACEFIHVYMKELLQCNTSITLGTPLPEQVSIGKKDIMALCTKLQGCDIDITIHSDVNPFEVLKVLNSGRVDPHSKPKYKR